MPCLGRAKRASNMIFSGRFFSSWNANIMHVTRRLKLNHKFIYHNYLRYRNHFLSFAHGRIGVKMKNATSNKDVDGGKVYRPLTEWSRNPPQNGSSVCYRSKSDGELKL